MNLLLPAALLLPLGAATWAAATGGAARTVRAALLAGALLALLAAFVPAASPSWPWVAALGVRLTLT
ncbi:MAG: hypothetical protein JSR54_14860, partial [Proteobacteria bacterium]|nr:hypothetical protein [Pseudomonadota bacterium]